MRVTGRTEIGGTRGPVTALFVLLGLLLNVASATGQLDRDPRSARLGNGEIVRTTSTARVAGRADDDRADRDEIAGPIPPAPRLVSLGAASHPAGLSSAPSAASLPLAPSAHYRARAPPAA